MHASPLLTPLKLQCRCGDKPVKFQVICPQLPPKRDCSPKRVKSFQLEHVWYTRVVRTWPGSTSSLSCFFACLLACLLARLQVGPMWRIALVLGLTGDLGTRHILSNSARYEEPCACGLWEREGAVIDRRDALDLMHDRSRMTIDPRIPRMPGRSMSGFQRRHDRSRMTIDPRIPTMPGRSMSGFQRRGRHCLHQAL